MQTLTSQYRLINCVSRDVLLALTGEGLTLRLDELDPMIDTLNPTWIVPMHYNLAPVSGQKRVMTKCRRFH